MSKPIHPKMRTHHMGVPVSASVWRHNAYTVGWEDGAMDCTEHYLSGLEHCGDDYREGFDAGREARSVAFSRARERGHSMRKKETPNAQD